MEHVSLAVIGGGITALLVQKQIPEAVIYDWRSGAPAQRLTRNYGANYLWAPIPGYRCRQFPVVTHVDGQPATAESVYRYKAKILKSSDMNGWERQFTEQMIGYDFDEPLSGRIKWGHRIERIDKVRRILTIANRDPVSYDTLISTIPLYSLLSMADVSGPRLEFKPIYVKTTARPPDAPFPSETMYVNYLSDDRIRPYRLCDRDGERHFESIVPYENGHTHRIPPGKIYPNPHVTDTRRTLEGYNIYCFGRFGAWRPDELIHETWDRITRWRVRQYGT